MSDGERVTIKVRENGPYKVTGPVRLIDADGNEFDLAPHTKNDSIVLCRCGGSQTKPFCDSTHSEIGFCAAERAVAAASESSARLDPTDLRAVLGVYEDWADGDFTTPEIFDPAVAATWAAEVPNLARLGLALERIIPAGSSLVAFVRIGRDETEARVAHVWRIEDGRCVDLKAYAERSAAVRAVGLEGA